MSELAVSQELISRRQKRGLWLAVALGVALLVLGATMHAAGVYSGALIAFLFIIDLGLGGVLFVMINNAATYSGTPLLATSSEEWHRVLEVNLTGMFYGCKRAIAQMITQEPRHEVRGRVINLGSQQGIVTCPRDPPYGVSKAGAIYLTRQIAVDYARDLIVCNCISPGKIVTGAPGLPTDPALLENAQRRTPWPRLGRPEDIANAAVFLASDRATYITGSNLVVDGGWLAG